MENEKIPESYLDTQEVLPKGWIKPDGSRYSFEEIEKNKDKFFFEFYNFMYDILLRNCQHIENQKEILKLLQENSPTKAEMLENSKLFTADVDRVVREWEEEAKLLKGENEDV